jgi:hypothetical protein
MEHGLISGLNLDLAANPFHQQHEDMKHTTRCILANIMCMVFGFFYTLGKWPEKQNMTYGLHVGLKKGHDIPQNHYQSNTELFPAEQKARFQQTCAAVCGRTTTSCQAP